MGITKPKKIVRSKEYYLKRLARVKSDVEELDLAKKSSTKKKAELASLRSKFKQVE